MTDNQEKLLDFVENNNLYYDALNVLKNNDCGFFVWDLDARVDENTKKVFYKDPVTNLEVEEYTIALNLTRKHLKKYSKCGNVKIHIVGMEVDGELEKQMTIYQNIPENEEVKELVWNDIVSYLDYNKIETKEELLKHLEKAYRIYKEKENIQNDYKFMCEDKREQVEERTHRIMTRYWEKSSDEKMTYLEMVNFLEYESENLDSDIFEMLRQEQNKYNKHKIKTYYLNVKIDRETNELIVSIPKPKEKGKRKQETEDKRITLAELRVKEDDFLLHYNCDTLELHVVVIGEMEDDNIYTYLCNYDVYDDEEESMYKDFCMLLEHLHIDTRDGVMNLLYETYAHYKTMSGIENDYRLFGEEPFMYNHW